MTLTIRVDLPAGRFDAGAEDSRKAEWPPHPARVHCALVASARSTDHSDLLRWLERQPPPQVWAERQPLGSVVRAGYVVTNRTQSSPTSQFHPGRGNQLRRRAGSALATSGFALVWPGVQIDERAVAILDGLARSVPYVGRAESTAVLTVSTHSAEFDPGWVCFEPTDQAGGEVELRVPYAGYTEALEEVFLDGGRAWEVAHRVGYQQVSRLMEHRPPLSPPMVSSPHTEMLTYAIRPGYLVDGLQAGMVTSQLRAVVMGKVGEVTGGRLPAAISGHDAATIPHLAYVPLLDVAHQHARGHLVGVGVALPGGQPETRAELLRGLRPDQPLTLHLPFGTLPLQSSSQRRATRIDPSRSRWSAEYWTQPSRRWASVTPVVLDRFPRHRTDIGEEITKACTRVGLPEPEDVAVGSGPMIRGGAALRRRHLARSEHRPRLFTHAVVTFPVPVRGVVLLGAQRYLGMGLFAPLNGGRRQARPQEVVSA